MHTIVAIPLFMSITTIFDFLVNNYVTFGRNDDLRWYYLHVQTNLITSVITFPDMLSTIVKTNPLYLDFEATNTAMCATFSLHLYHILFFNKIRRGDLIHHINMIGTMMLSILFNGGSLTNYLVFYLNGFPGLVYYSTMILVEHKFMKRSTEKTISMYTHTWIRNPGIIYGASLLWIYWNNGVFDKINYLVPLFILITILWNGPYYAMYVAHSCGRSNS